MFSARFFRQSAWGRRAVTGFFVLFLVPVCLGAWQWHTLTAWISNIPWIGPTIASWISGKPQPFVLYAGAEGDERSEAQALYQSALKSKAEGKWLEAIEAFKKVEPLYPGLKDVISVQLAELYAKLPKEDMAQLRYKLLIEDSWGSPLKAQALYGLAQSQLRANQTEDGLNTLRRLRKEYPGSDWAVGALYYLGINAEDGSREQVEAWQQYLEKAPDGRFALELAPKLKKTQGDRASVEQQRAIGVALVKQKRDWKPAARMLLEAGVTKETWFPLMRAYLELGELEDAEELMIRWLSQPTEQEKAQDAIDALLAKTPGSESKVLLQRLSSKSHLEGSDYVLWRLAQTDTDHSLGLFKRLLDTHPNSLYAPESSWALTWDQLVKGNDQAFLNRAIAHLESYPHSHSAARTLYWMGQVYEQHHHEDKAVAAYRKLLDNYAWEYYAYRAHSRLNDLQKQGNVEAASWKTSSANTLPSEVAELNVALLFAQAIEEDQQAQLNIPLSRLVSVATELAAIEAKDDLATYINEAFSGELPPAIASWLYQKQGQTALGMRLLRNHVFKRFWETGTPPSEQELKLLYPINYTELITSNAKKNKLDPWLVMSLMREESYFNPLAVSSSYALGLMQLLPSTAQDVARWENLNDFQAVELFKPQVNVRLGSRYLGYLHERFDGASQLAVGAYNGGPGAMKGWIAASKGSLSKNPDWFVETIPYQESRLYIQKVFGSYWNYRRLYTPNELG